MAGRNSNRLRRSGGIASGSGSINVRPPAQGAWRAVVASSSAILPQEQQGIDGNTSISMLVTSSPAGGSDGSNGGSGAIEHAHEADGAAATKCTQQEQTARGRANELAGEPQASLSQPRPVTTQTTPSADPNHHAPATSTTSLPLQKLPATTTTKLTKLARHEKKASLARKRKSKSSSVEPVQAGGVTGEGGGDGRKRTLHISFCCFI